MAEWPATTQQLNNDDKHREYVLNMNKENIQKWKEEAAADSSKLAHINAERVRIETEERHQLREKWVVADTEARMKSREREGEMARGVGGMNGAPPYHTGVPQGMSHPSPMYPPHPHPHPKYARMQPMQQVPPQMQHIQHPSMVGQHPAAAAANGMSSVDANNSRKRPSNTPNYEDQAKRMMMDNSVANRFPYPQASPMYPHNGFPAHTGGMMYGAPPYHPGLPQGMPHPYPMYPPHPMSMYGMMQPMQHVPPHMQHIQHPSLVGQHPAAAVANNGYPYYQMSKGGPYGFPSYSTPSCPMQQQQHQMQQMQQQQQAMSSQQQPPQTPSFPSSMSSVTPSTSTPSVAPHASPNTTSSSSTVVPPSSSLHDVSLDTPNNNLDLEGLMDDRGTLTELQGDLQLEEWPEKEELTSNGEEPSFLSPPQSNQMPTPGGGDEMVCGGGASSSSTHASPLTASPFHPSPHQSYGLNALMNHVSSVGAPPQENAHTMPPPPRHSTLPAHLQSSFPMTTSAHTQPSLLSLSSSSSLPPLHPHSLPPVHPPPAPPAKKSRSKKAAAPKQTPPVPQPPVQFPLNGMGGGMYGMTAHPSLSNQFAPPPGAGPSLPSTAGMPTQDMAAIQQQQQQQHYDSHYHHMMMVMRHQQSMQHMHRQQQGRSDRSQYALGDSRSIEEPAHEDAS